MLWGSGALGFVPAQHTNSAMVRQRLRDGWAGRAAVVVDMRCHCVAARWRKQLQWLGEGRRRSERENAAEMRVYGDVDPHI